MTEHAETVIAEGWKPHWNSDAPFLNPRDGFFLPE